MSPTSSRLGRNNGAYSGEYSIGYWRTFPRLLGLAPSVGGRAGRGNRPAGANMHAYLESGSRLGLAHLYVLLADLRIAAGDRDRGARRARCRGGVRRSQRRGVLPLGASALPGWALVMGEAPDTAGATLALKRAVEIAASQNAMLPLLRALAQLIGHQRKLGEPGDSAAAEQLAAVCEWFGSDCELADVTRARALLEPEAARP